QVFPAVAATRANLRDKDSWINALVSPSGKVGYVNISTGPISSTSEVPAVVPVKTAIDLVKDMGGQALKFLPMKGLSVRVALKAGVPKVIPHVYSSIIDKDTGETRVADVERLYAMIQERVREY